MEAYSTAVEQTLAFPDTGNLAKDLTLQLQAFVRLLTEERTGRVVAELIGAAQSDHELSSALRQHYTRLRRRLAVEILERARARGELRDDVDLEVVVDQLWGRVLPALPAPGPDAHARLRGRLGGQPPAGCRPAGPGAARA